MHNVVLLLPSEDTILNSTRMCEIIATSPWVKGEGDLPHRVVLRDFGLQYVVHTQVLSVETNNVFFCHGNYFPYNKNTQDVNFQKAWECFKVKCDMHLGVPYND